MRQRLKVRVTLFSVRNGGRPVPPDVLACGSYRPHLVVGDPNQKRAQVDEKNQSIENYLGVNFLTQDEPLEPEKTISAEIETVYAGVDYSALKKGATFTIREGGSIVGNGEVL